MRDDASSRDDTELLRTLVREVAEIRRWVRFVGILIVVGMVSAAIAGFFLALVLTFGRFNLMGSRGNEKLLCQGSLPSSLGCTAHC